jgi:tight adherence protein C
MTQLLAGGGLFVCLALIIYAVAIQVEERSTVRASLRQLDEYQIENIRDKVLLEPLGTRLLRPVLGGVLRVGQRFWPTGYADTVRKKLIISGKQDRDSLDRFLAVRVLTIAAIPVFGVLAFGVMPLKGRMPMVVFLGFTAIALLGPDVILNRRMQDRQGEIRKRLPDILDLLTISVEAGLGFDQALDRTIANVPGPMSDEFSRMLGETRAGSSRSEALKALDERTDVPEVRSFVLALLQADTFGVSIGRVLRAQADEMRIRRRQSAQERAQKAPVKMLVPMVFCIFPALFVVVLGPAGINLYHNFVK